MHVIAIDFETAGNGADSACAVGMVRIRDNGIEDSFYRLIRPPDSWVRYTEVHGLTWAMLKDQPSFREVWPEMQAFIQDATHFVAHNASFDRRILLGGCTAAGAVAPSLPFVCTLQASRKLLRLPSHGLNAVCEHCGFTFIHHQAEEDARAAAKVFLFLCERGLLFT